MKKTQPIILFSLTLFFLCIIVFTADAQNHLRINLKFGDSVEIPIDEIDKITFDLSMADEEIQKSIIRLITLKAVPNPAGEQTIIEYTLAAEGNVVLEVFQLTGVLTERHDLGQHEPGTHNFTLKTNMYAAGTYVCRVSQHNQAIAEKIIVKH